MELPFEKTVCRYWKQKLYTMLTREESQEWKIPDSMPEVGRIISSWGQVILRNKDCQSDHITISGGIMVWVLYAPEDGGDLQRLETWIPFQAQTDLAEPLNGGTLRVEPFLAGVDARVASNRKILIRGEVSLVIQALDPDQMEVLTLGQLPEDVETRMEAFPFLLTREAGEKRFVLDDELSLPQGAPQVEQLVYYRVWPEVTEQRVLGGKMPFRGNLRLHVLYLDPEKRLRGEDLTLPFAQYAALEGEYEEQAQGEVVFCVNSLDLEPLGEGRLQIKCGLTAQYLIQSRETVELLRDCYSPCREVNLVKELVNLPAWLDTQKTGVTLTSSVPGGEDAMVDLIFFPSAPNVTSRPGAVDLEVGGVFHWVMEDGDGSYFGKNVRAGESLHLQTQCETVCFQEGHTLPEGRREQGSWRTDTRVMVDLKSLCSQPMEMVSGVELGVVGQPDPERPSVIIRSRGEEESLWDLAKKCGSTVGAIRRMNHLEGEPEADRLLLIPVL